MKEDFIHYLWRLKRFDLHNLSTTKGEKIIIQNGGEHNTNAGPDFLNARIQIGETLWAGNVEIHIKSSEWTKHQHHKDKAYNNVILHVVFEEDKTAFRENGEAIPCLELAKRIPPNLSTSYIKLVNNEYWIPCQHQFHTVKEITRNIWLDRLLVERLEQKTAYIKEVLNRNKNNWEETFYQILARNFGVKVNADPFELLARSIPLLTLAKHKSNLLQIEALLFGQAGLLAQDFEDDYPNQLKKEYAFLQQKYQLQAINTASWKFMRLRPANFPSIRIAQFATLIYQSVHLFSKVLAAQNVKEVENMFEVKLSNYWQTHYVFDKTSVKRKKTLGKSTIHLFVINTIAPFIFLYGQEKGEERFKEKALQFLEELKPEKNSIISKWQELGVEPTSAYQTQALLQLKNEYCKHKRCLECSIGNAILK